MAVEDPQWQRLMAAAQAGDKASYGRLLAAAIPVLRRMARSRWPGIDAALVEDIVQETLIGLHASLHLYDPVRPFIPFLYGIMKFRGRDAIRKTRRMQTRELGIDDFPETFEGFGTEEHHDQGLQAEELRAEVDRLPAGQKVAVEMTKLRELSLEEASRASGMTVGALKVATHRGIAALRKKLKGG
ncbi:RNA polymerase sigma factor [Acidisoma sp. C75]